MTSVATLPRGRMNVNLFALRKMYVVVEKD